MRGKRRIREGQPSFFTRILCLALFFLGGACLGYVLASGVPETTGTELETYLRGYCSLADGPSPETVFSALVLYFRYPLLAVLLGFCSIGVILLPLGTAVFGCFLSFSVCCFAAAFGRSGVLLALAVFGLRCLVTLPCYFLLAVPAWETSAALALASFGRGRRAAPIRYGRDWWLRTAGCAACLLAGVCLELLCSPWLLRLALGRILA